MRSSFSGGEGGEAFRKREWPCQRKGGYHLKNRERMRQSFFVFEKGEERRAPSRNSGKKGGKRGEGGPFTSS